MDDFRLTFILSQALSVKSNDSGDIDETACDMAGYVLEILGFDRFVEETLKKINSQNNP